MNRTKRLKEVLNNISILQNHNLEDTVIGKIVYDSRKVEKNSLFVAVTGFSTDGHNYIKEAESKGAVAAVVENSVKDVSIPQYIVKYRKKYFFAIIFVP